MTLERWAVVAGVALATACGDGGTTVGTSSVSDGGGGGASSGNVAPGADGGLAAGNPGGSADGGIAGGDGGSADGGASDGGASDGGAGGSTTACPPRITKIATNLTIATADADYLYEFTGQQLLRMPLGGDRREVLVDGIDTHADFDVSVDDRYVYWLVRDGNGVAPALVRAPKTGGAAVALGPGGGDFGTFAYVIADPIYFTDEASLDSMPPGGGVVSYGVKNPNDAAVLTANATAAFYLGVNDGLALHSVPLQALATAHSPGSADADAEFVYVAWQGDVRRYRISDGSSTIITHFAGESGVTDLRIFGAQLYVHAGDLIVRLAKDGTDSHTMAGGVNGPWTLGGDSLYFNAGADLWRACR